MAFQHLTRKERRHVNKKIEAENSKFGDKFVELKFDPNINRNCIKAFRNRKFELQIFRERCGVRLSICRTSIDRKGAWLDGITWDELQHVKNECGYFDRDAIEVYPAQKDIVNVANMRHLWILDEPLDFVWRNR